MNYRLKAKLKIKWPHPGVIVDDCFIILKSRTKPFLDCSRSSCTPKKFFKYGCNVTMRNVYFSNDKEFEPYLTEALAKYRADYNITTNLWQPSQPEELG